MQINSINNGCTPSFGMAFRPTKKAAEALVETAMGKVDTKRALDTLNFFNGSFTDVLNLNIDLTGRGGKKLLVELADQDGKPVAKKVNPKKLLDNGIKIVTGMRDKLIARQDRIAAREARKASADFLKGMGDTIEKTRNAVLENYVKQIAQNIE